MPMIAATLLLANAFSATTPAVLTPMDALAASRDKAGFEIYMPDSSAIGYTLTDVEVTPVNGRKVVHLKFVNAKAMNSFDLFEAPAADSTQPEKDLTSILASKVFPVSAAEDDTLVSIRKAKTDVMLVGSLMTAPSAKKMLERSAPLSK